MDANLTKELQKLVKDARHIVFLGGAWVSTDSGISDFRSPQGLYNVKSKYGRPYEEMLSHHYFEEDPATFYDFYWSTMVAPNAKPNKAHFALAKFEEKFPNKITVVTQNIDGLHQKAGSKRVLEVHGSTDRYTCLRCGEHYHLDQIPMHGVPHCEKCGGMLKPDVVLYEEPLDEDILLSAVNATRFADLMIVAGTSMRVYPIAALPDYFGRDGKIIMINAEATPFDEQCDYVIHEDVGDVLEKILLGD